MKVTYMKKSASLFLVLAVFMSFTLATTMEVNAAAKTKTFYVMTEVKNTYTSTYTYDGKTDKSTSSSKVSYSYNKNGLRTQAKYNDGTKAKFTRNKSGFVTKTQSYDKNGKLTGVSIVTVNKYGDTTKEVNYTYEKGKKKKESTSTYSYYSKGKLKKYTSKVNNGGTTTSVFNFDKKGNITKAVSTYGSGNSKVTDSSTYTYKFDKKGNATKTVTKRKNTSRYGTSNSTVTEKAKYTYKNGKVVKIVINSETKSGGKVTGNDKSTQTYTYKGKNLVKTVYSSSSEDDGSKSTFKNTTTYKYKKVKVPKKYWKLFV